jgi:biopolymer transport protein ExbB/TolQ
MNKETINTWIAPGIIAICSIIGGTFLQLWILSPPEIVNTGVHKIMIILKILIWALWIISIVSMWYYVFKGSRAKKYYRTEVKRIKDEMIKHRKEFDEEKYNYSKQKDEIQKINTALNKTCQDHAVLFDRLESLCNVYFQCRDKKNPEASRQAKEAYDRYKKEEKEIYGDKPFLQINHYFT